MIPPIVVQCVAYLNRPIGLNEEGLFRIPGDMSQVRKLRAGFVAGQLHWNILYVFLFIKLFQTKHFWQCTEPE